MNSPSTAYVATPNQVNPAATQALFPNWLANPIGSEYASNYSYDQTIHLKRAVNDTIVQNFPAQYNIFRIIFSKTVIYKPLDEWTWTEQNWPRAALVSTGIVAGGATQAVVVQAGQTAHVVTGDLLFYPDDTTGIVTSVNAATSTVNVAAPTGGTLTALAANDVVIAGPPVIADGMNTALHYDRIVTTQFTNYIMMGQRNNRWTTMTAKKYKNSGQTDLFEKDLKMKQDLAYQDVFQQFFNGQKGEVSIAIPAGAGLTGGTYRAKLSWGIFPFMQSNGAQHATTTLATIESDFRTLAFNTNYKNVNVPRFILGTDKALSALDMVLKNPIRYNPSDEIYNMGLKEYELGTMRFVKMVCPLFENRANLFPRSWENRLLVLDLDTIDPVCMEGYQMFEQGNTSAQYKGNGGANDWIDYWIQYMVSMQMTNVDSSFYMDILGI
jgi:hypothetical protein